MAKQRRHLMVAPAAEDSIGSDYPDIFLECRVDRHRWRLIGFYHQNGAIVRASTCERCHCDRHQRWTAGGSIISNSYDYPDNYQIAGGVSGWEVRSEVLNRVTIYQSADAMHDALFTGKSPRATKKSAG